MAVSQHRRRVCEPPWTWADVQASTPTARRGAHAYACYKQQRLREHCTNRIVTGARCSPIWHKSPPGILRHMLPTAHAPSTLPAPYPLQQHGTWIQVWWVPLLTNSQEPEAERDQQAGRPGRLGPRSAKRRPDTVQSSTTRSDQITPVLSEIEALGWCAQNDSCFRRSARLARACAYDDDSVLDLETRSQARLSARPHVCWQTASKGLLGTSVSS